jgi:tetratricopeptide (TPR) repeat protein
MKRPRRRPISTPPVQEPNLSFVPVATAIFVVALAVRLIHIWQIRRAPFFTVLMGDAQGYDAWGKRIARGDWLGHEVFYQAPLYPYFLGLIYSLVGRNMLGDASLHYDLGSLLLEAHRLPEAIDEFRAALKLTPDSFAAHNNLGIALGSQGDLDEAIVQFQFALELQPQSADARRNLASALQARAQTR